MTDAEKLKILIEMILKRAKEIAERREVMLSRINSKWWEIEDYIY